MANYDSLYDFSLFEERDGNAVRAAEPKRRVIEQEVPAPKENIVELPKKELEKNRRPKAKPLRAIRRVVSFALVMTVVVSLVYSQVQLTELTDQINTSTKQLAEEEALEIQLEMQTAEKINTADVEEYARKQLGMSKINEGQVVYMNMANSDKGTVLQETKEYNFFEKMVNEVKSWFA